MIVKVELKEIRRRVQEDTYGETLSYLTFNRDYGVITSSSYKGEDLQLTVVMTNP